MNYKELKRKIKEGISPLYIFFGEEVILRSYMAKKLIDEAVEPEFSDFNLLVMTDESLSLSAAADFFSSYPVMSERKLLYLKDTPLLTLKCPDSDGWRALLSSIPDGVTVLISQDSADKRSALYKALSKTAEVCEFSFLERSELKERVIRKFSSEGKNIRTADLEYFLDMCPPDLTGIRLNADKLIAFTGNKTEITKSDIENTITPPLLNRVYDISEAVMNKNSDYALRLLADLKKGGESAVRILSVLGGYFNDLLRASAVNEENMSYSDAVGAMRLSPSRKFLADKMLKRAKTTDLKKITKCLSLCVKTENDIKNGNLPEWQALDLLVLDILSD